jgi:V8-like Glu-specific endopeptidase
MIQVTNAKVWRFSIGFIGMVAASLFLGGTTQARTTSNDLQVVYGDDNRLDLFQVTDPTALTLAASTALVTKANTMTTRADGSVALQVSSHLRSGAPVRNAVLCPEEPFVEQPTVGFCSAFLVAPDIMVTAGHCITSVRDCAEARFVFGFGLSQPNADLTSVPASQVFSCTSIISRALSNATGVDYAVIKLDRPVADRAPLALRRAGQPTEGMPLTVIGHPSCLPTKVTPGAIVRRIAGANYLVANTDTYGGNSGSAVFNSTTGEVEGILVRGENDFVRTPRGCWVSNRCAEGACRGEDITLISNVLPFVPAPVATTPTP